MNSALADKAIPRIAAARARELFCYDQETGVLTRRLATGNQSKAGDVAGSPDKDGYLVAKADGRAYKVHRLIWLIVTGTWPVGDIDHINGSRSDNRWGNLRDIPHEANNQNQRRARRDNRSGYLGVTRRANGKFYASICLNKRCLHLGVFTCAEQAHAAYLNAKRQLHSGNTL